jgi:hypothetical protein
MNIRNVVGHLVECLNTAKKIRNLWHNKREDKLETNCREHYKHNWKSRTDVYNVRNQRSKDKKIQR